MGERGGKGQNQADGAQSGGHGWLWIGVHFGLYNTAMNQSVAMPIGIETLADQQFNQTAQSDAVH